MQMKLALALLAPAAVVRAASPWVAAYSGKDCTGTILGNWTDGVTCGTFPLCLFAANGDEIASIYLNPETTSEGTSTAQVYNQTYCSSGEFNSFKAKGCHTTAKKFPSFVGTCT